MDQAKYTIYPEIKKITKINQISVFVSELILFTSVRITCILYDINGIAIDSRMYILCDEDYTNWGQSDTYLINWAKNKIAEEFSFQ